MKSNASCWDNGLFFYSVLYYELQSLRMLSESMSNGDLISELLEISPDDDEIAHILFNHLQYREELSTIEREKLVWYHTLYYVEDMLHITDEGEF